MISDDGERSKRREGRKEGRRRKDAAHGVLEARRASVIRAGRRAFVSKLLETGWVTADQVHENVTVPVDINPKVLGVVPGIFRIARLVTVARYVPSSRPIAHARILPVYELVDDGARVALAQWLLDNPAPADVVATESIERSADTTAEPSTSPPRDDVCPSVSPPAIPATIQGRLFDLGGNTDAQC